jgi:hypothetical protein
MSTVNDARRVFLSHSQTDREVAETLANAIRRTTLRQVDVWFSSDEDPNAGILAGETWAATITRRLRESRTLLALLTNDSVAKSWVYFECGFVAGREDTNDAKVVPVCFGLDPTRVPLPLALYQIYSLDTPEAFATLLAKIAGRFDLHFDRAMARPVIDECLVDLAAIRAKSRREASTMEARDQGFEQMRDLVDRRFMELAAMLSRDAAPGASGTGAAMPEYSVRVEIAFNDFSETELVSIRPTTSLQDVLDGLYFNLDRRVLPYRYLQQWVLLRASPLPQRPLIVRGVQEDVPASVVMPPGSRWRLVALNKPYTAGMALETSDGPVEDGAPGWANAGSFREDRERAEKTAG